MLTPLKLHLKLAISRTQSLYIYIPSQKLHYAPHCIRKKKKDAMNRRFLILLLLLTTTHIVLLHAVLDPVDFLALQSIRKSLSDLPGSNYFASWDFTSDPCNFAGVFCEADRVVALNLGDPRAGSPGLTGRLAPEIGKLSALYELTVVPGRIYGTLPESISQIKSLRFLAISQNFISGQIPAALGQLRLLQTLDLSFNQLTGQISPSLSSLSALTNLILCHNKLAGQIPAFGASQTLTRLDLKHNQLTGQIPPRGLPGSLQYLSLSWNMLSGPIDRALTGLSQLNYLDLSMNRFTGCVPALIFTFPITTLQLQRNELYGTVQPVDQVTIPTVDLSFNRLSGQISPLLSTVQNLYLNNNRFTGQVPSSFVDRLLSSGIQVLYLQHNYLTGIEINPTVEIPLTSSLCLQYNCMVLPVVTPCPLKAGKQKTRPTEQCMQWKG